ncbi:secondary thiamine-phosphate synthase enzyme YjbQ [Candidatus Berkiella aquae]|uniref:Secondary thiamine-phosphate synthase enzyme YjbQ n=1 Tax=Candidatus Berkiella aquae TaxID=295108 RepID=A0A0Q9YM55_9GAMM|nr:secondary thiamine-phosphate synthase enzyme YjbQ [Candidatus Berkiella aquae]MCS5710464.1 secondary thiamine-phosphate synthase enzyme YjbQ [Candidatus Berkiella aquae]
MSAFFQQNLSIQTKGRGTLELTREIQAWVKKSQYAIGLCHLFVKHTSASLIICENADPQVRQDLDHYFASLVPDGDSLFLHNDEGPDDMPAHIRTILTQTSLTIPIQEGRLALGTWQGIYLYEHRYAPHQREIIITIQG